MVESPSSVRIREHSCSLPLMESQPLRPVEAKICRLHGWHGGAGSNQQVPFDFTQLPKAPARRWWVKSYCTIP
jgi:hypothetical protein